MNRLQRFANMHPNDGEQEEWYWDRNLLEEDITCHAKKNRPPCIKIKGEGKKNSKQNNQKHASR